MATRYFAQNLAVGNPASGVGLCLLWTPQDRVLPALDSAHFALAGNLYSRDGISFLVRNVLAQPTIRTLLLCGKDLTGSGAALVALMQHGVDAQHRIVGDGTRLHPELPVAAIDLFRNNVALHDARDTMRPDAIARLLSALPQDATPFASEPLCFPYNEPAAATLPAETTGFVVRAATIRSAYLQLLWQVLTFGLEGATQHTSNQCELLDVLTVVQGEPVVPAQFSHAEWMPFTSERLGTRQANGRFSGYLGQFVYASRSSGVSYTYGNKLRAFEGVDQVAAIVADLRQSGHSRRAVATLWNPHTDVGAKSPPCLNLVQARLRDGRLHLTAYFRSHDIYRAWAMNAYGLCALQGLIGEQLGDGVVAGDLAILSHSAHIYAHDWQAARGLVDEYYRPADPRLVRDPRGSFVIMLEPAQDGDDAPGTIAVRHYTPDGEHLQTFRGSSAAHLGPEITPFVGGTNHALYLGRELQKAELALQLGRPEAYHQDRPLEL